MTRDWGRLAVGLERRGDAIVIDLDDQRRHLVEVIEHHDGWELSGGAANAQQLAAAQIDVATLWSRNRYLNLVGYVVDTEGSAWVTAWLPFAGITAREFQETARHVAIEADRLEFYCTGLDSL